MVYTTKMVILQGRSLTNKNKTIFINKNSKDYNTYCRQQNVIFPHIFGKDIYLKEVKTQTNIHLSLKLNIYFDDNKRVENIFAKQVYTKY